MSNIKTFKDYQPNNDRANQYIDRSNSNIGLEPTPARSLDVENPNANTNAAQSRLSPARIFCESFFPKFSWKTFTFAVTIVQIVIFIATKIVDKAHDNKSWNCVLYTYGAKYTPAIASYHHVHRLILPIFLHGGWAHIIFNMLSQSMYGYFLENHYGVKRFSILYLAAGFGGNLLSAVTNKHNISIGASSAIFGLFALQLAYLIQNYKNLGPRRNMIITFMVIIIIVSLATIGESDTIDGMAHLGGFLVGVMISFQYFPLLSNIKIKIAKIIVAILLAIYLLATLIVALTFKGLDEAAELTSNYCDSVI